MALFLDAESLQMYEQTLDDHGTFPDLFQVISVKIEREVLTLLDSELFFSHRHLIFTLVECFFVLTNFPVTLSTNRFTANHILV